MLAGLRDGVRDAGRDDGGRDSGGRECDPGIGTSAHPVAG